VLLPEDGERAGFPSGIAGRGGLRGLRSTLDLGAAGLAGWRGFPGHAMVMTRAARARKPLHARGARIFCNPGARSAHTMDRLGTYKNCRSRRERERDQNLKALSAPLIPKFA